MTAQLIYSIEPTRIYHKQCSHCGLNYLGKTADENIDTYPGSGKHWKRHLKKHNAKSIHVWNSDWFYDTSIVNYALDLSNKLNIVESKEWANEKPENGLDGGDNSEFIDYTKVVKSLQNTMVEKYGVDNFSKTKEGRKIISERMFLKNASGEMNHSKMKQTKNNPLWKETVGKEATIKATETRNKTISNPKWIETVEVERRKKIGNTNSSKAKRPIVQKIKELQKIKKIPLKRGWYQKNDEELTIIYERYKEL